MTSGYMAGRYAAGRGHFPNEQATLKVLYLAIRSPIANRTNGPGGPPGGRLR